MVQKKAGISRIRKWVAAVLSILLLMAIPMKATAAEMSVEFGAKKYDKGGNDQFSVCVYLKSDVAVTEYSVEIEYDVSRLEYLDGADEADIYEGRLTVTGSGEYLTNIKVWLDFKAISGGEAYIKVIGATATGTDGTEYIIENLGEVPVNLRGEDVSEANMQEIISAKKDFISSQSAGTTGEDTTENVGDGTDDTVSGDEGTAIGTQTGEADTDEGSIAADDILVNSEIGNNGADGDTDSAAGGWTQGKNAKLYYWIIVVIILVLLVVIVVATTFGRKNKENEQPDGFEYADNDAEDYEDAVENTRSIEFSEGDDTYEEEVGESEEIEDNEPEKVAATEENENEDAEADKESEYDVTEKSEENESAIVDMVEENGSEESEAAEEGGPERSEEIEDEFERSEAVEEIESEPEAVAAETIAVEETAVPDDREILFEAKNATVTRKVRIARGNTDEAGVGIQFRYVNVLEDISVKLYKGEMIEAVGSNGREMEAFMGLVLGKCKLSLGEITVLPMRYRVVTAGSCFNPGMTAHDNIFRSGALMGHPKAVLEKNYDKIVKFAGADEYMDMYAKDIPQVMINQLEVAMALMDSRADMVVLGDVLAASDETFIRKCNVIFEKMIAKNMTILLIGKLPEAVAVKCNRTICIEKGHIVG